MNETIKTLMERRSIRKYKTDSVPEELIDVIVNAGLYAPSARNLQPWHITVVKNKEVIKDINSAIKSEFKKMGNEHLFRNAKDPNYCNFHHAPMIIIVSGESSSNYKQGDPANVMENICLAAHSLGLGTCYNASFLLAFQGDKKDELYKKLEIPEGFEPVFSTSLGYADESNPSAPERRKNTVNFIV